jgi:hypothetical protein
VAIAVSVGTAAALHVMTLMLALRSALILTGLVLALLMLSVGIGGRSGRRGLRNGGGGDRKRERGYNDLHLISPSEFD